MSQAYKKPSVEVEEDDNEWTDMDDDGGDFFNEEDEQQFQQQYQEEEQAIHTNNSTTSSTNNNEKQQQQQQAVVINENEEDHKNWGDEQEEEDEKKLHEQQNNQQEKQQQEQFKNNNNQRQSQQQQQYNNKPYNQKYQRQQYNNNNQQQYNNNNQQQGGFRENNNYQQRKTFNNNTSNNNSSSINIPPDITIQCKDNKEMKAHLFVLSLCSEVFEKMFYGEFKKEMIIDMTDYDVLIVEEFLKFIYCNAVNLNEKNCFSLFNLSKQYMIKELTNECTGYLIQIIEDSCDKNINELLQIYDQSILFEEEELIKKCLSKLEVNSSVLFQENNNLLNELSKEGMKRLLESDNLNAKEIDIFTKVLQWIEKNNDENDTDLFNEFKVLIRFPIMSNAELLTTVDDSKMLSDRELLNLFKFKEFGSKIETLFKTNPRNVTLFTKGIYQEKLQLSVLLKQGWKIIYQKDYSHATTKDELLKIKSSYDKNRLLCVCGKEKNKDIIKLAAIDTIENVFNETNDRCVASKGGVEGLYWYFVEDYSFGFSNESKIELGSADTENGNLRLSWHLQESGGWRVGENKDLNSSTSWEKLILIL